MTTIYIVTAGDYSEYAIHAVFSTAELAQQYIDAQSWRDQAEIEEWALDPDADYLRQGMSWYEVIIGVASSDVLSLKKDRMGESDIRFIPGNEQFAQVIGLDYWAQDHLIISCWAKDEQHAAKIAMEKRAVWLANQQ